MKKLLYIILIISLSLMLECGCSSRADSSVALFGRLDSLIDKRLDFERAKLLRIAELRQKEHSAVTATDRYLYATLLSDEFAIYKSDSAMKYFDKRLGHSPNAATRSGRFAAR